MYDLWQYNNETLITLKLLFYDIIMSYFIFLILGIIF